MKLRFHRKQQKCWSNDIGPAHCAITHTYLHVAWYTVKKTWAKEGIKRGEEVHVQAAVHFTQIYFVYKHEQLSSYIVQFLR